MEIVKNAEFHFWKIIELQGIKKQLFCFFFICWYFVNTKWIQTWMVMRLKKSVQFKKKKKRGFIFQHTLIEILTLFLNSILAAIWADTFLSFTDPGGLLSFKTSKVSEQVSTLVFWWIWYLVRCKLYCSQAWFLIRFDIAGFLKLIRDIFRDVD